ncbi:MAG: D-alanyl-D-alanine carboxypeptidase/D-alanyl-D-alanine-endopeptidase [Bacteroidales bacterium]|nr:D-alanyl-D-alanine carboxypeptidase/D-alanyl-D-alanine-endopeptidase [Bacteroidales bacterium]
MKKLFAVISVALLLFSRSATAGIPPTKAQETIETVFEKEPAASGIVGAFAMTVSGDTLACINPRKKMVPASNMKILTTGIALLVLGEDYKFETSIGYSGTIEDGVLHGDIYIIGGGDPTIGSEAKFAESLNLTLSKWLRFIQGAGIRSIDGLIIGDSRFFGASDPQGRNWGREDMGTYFGIGPSGLNFYENKQNLLVTPGSQVGGRPSVSPRYPEAPWMKIRVSATTGKEKTTNDLYYVPSEGAATGDILGHFPIDRKSHTLECSNLYGAYTCAFYFYRYLHNNGIKSAGYADISPLGNIRPDLNNPESGSPAVPISRLTILGSTYSAPLSEIVKETNKESNNFFAETLFKMIGMKKMHSAIADSCIVAAENHMAGMGLNVKTNCQYDDGCGLSRANYVSPSFFTAFLKSMTRTGCFDTFLSSLPTVGIDGTMKYRLSKCPDELRHRIHAKTGSMNGVRCVSGYITSTDGLPEHTIVFSVMANNVIGKSWAINNQIDSVIEALASEN